MACFTAAEKRLRLAWAEQVPQASDPGETNSSAQREPSEMPCSIIIATIRPWGDCGGGLREQQGQQGPYRTAHGKR